MGSQMANRLEVILVLLVAVSHGSHGVEWKDLRTHYSVNALNGFFKMNRTAAGAEASGWIPINSECLSSGTANTFAGFRYENPEDAGAVLIFDVNGIIAGIQCRMSHEEILLEEPVNPFRFDLVPMFQNITENGKEYFLLTAYFVSPDIICTSGRTEGDLETEGTGTGLWFQNGPTPSDLIVVPRNRSEAINEGWTKNMCFPAMGLHNFYKVEEYQTYNCNQVQPTFLLFNNAGELHGFGFVTNGMGISKYFEHSINTVTSIILGPPVPPCVLDYNDKYRRTTMHVYFTEQPWLIVC